MTPSPSALGLPLVSVIIPVYNGETDLPELLTCLLAQTYPADQVEYLLVDNGSRDRTAEMIQAAAATARQHGVQLQYVSEAQIQSSYAARNSGIRAAQGQLLVFTDADCRPHPQWLAGMVAGFDDPAVGLVVGEVTALPSTTLLEKYADQGGTLSQKYTLAHPFYPYGQTANLAVRRSVLTKVGLFRPYLTTGGDADLCWRIQQETAWRLFFAEQAIVQHRHRSTLRELKKQWRRYGQSHRYLHELHGVALSPVPTIREYLYRWSRWVLKELPLTTLKAIAGRATWVDFCNTPISLICLRARIAGQQASVLPELARQIAGLSPEISYPLGDVQEPETSQNAG